MKGMVALELEVVRLLADQARAAGLDPARDPIPGLRRDVLFTCTADEEAGGTAGARWLVDAPSRLAARRRCGQRVRRRDGDRGRPAALPDPGRREGLRRLPHHRPRHVGPWLDAAPGQRGGHGRRGDRPARHARARVASRRSWRASSNRRPRRCRRRPPRSCAGSPRTIRARRPGGRGHAGRLRPDVRPGARRPAARHDQPGRDPRRHQVQRDPR